MGEGEMEEVKGKKEENKIIGRGEMNPTLFDFATN